MVDRLGETKTLFAQAENLHDLISLSTPSLSECLGRGKAGDIRATQSVFTLAHLEKRIFNFKEFRDQTWIFDGEKFLPRKQVDNMLVALKDTRIIYGRQRGRYFVRRNLYEKLSELVDEHFRLEAESLI